MKGLPFASAGQLRGPTQLKIKETMSESGSMTQSSFINFVRGPSKTQPVTMEGGFITLCIMPLSDITDRLPNIMMPQQDRRAFAQRLSTHWPNFWQSILDLLIRFELHRGALIGDMEKAFLMITVADCDRDVLWFL